MSRMERKRGMVGAPADSSGSKKPRYEERDSPGSEEEEEIAIHVGYDEDTLGLSSEGETRIVRPEYDYKLEDESFPLAKLSSRAASGEPHHRRKVRRHYRGGSGGETTTTIDEQSGFLGHSRREDVTRRDRPHSHSPFGGSSGAGGGGGGRGERFSKHGEASLKRSSSERVSDRSRGRERGGGGGGGGERYGEVITREWERSRQYKDRYSSQKYRLDERREDPRGSSEHSHRDRERFEEASRPRSKEGGLSREYPERGNQDKDHLSSSSSSYRERYSHSPRRIEKTAHRGDYRDYERGEGHRSLDRAGEKLPRHHSKSRHKRHGRHHRSRRSDEERVSRSRREKMEVDDDGDGRKATPLAGETIEELIKDLEESSSSSSSSEYSGEGGEGGEGVRGDRETTGRARNSAYESTSEKSEYSDDEIPPPKRKIIRVKRKVQKSLTPLEEGERSSGSDTPGEMKEEDRRPSLSPLPSRESKSSSAESSPAAAAQPAQVMRSKFDSDESEEEEIDRETPAKLRKDYSGYHESILSENESEKSDKMSQSEDKEVTPGETQPTEGEEKNEDVVEERSPSPVLPCYYPALMGCRSVENYECLNRIEEGTYGVVYRGKDKKTHEVVALKRLKMEKEKEGFPITSLREINMLLKAEHQNIVHVREIVVGSNMDKIFIVMDYVEHDLKALMETMKAPFLPGEVKTLMIQLLRAVHHLHDNWILHRDLKTSNLLLSHKGILKVGDFGLAREYGSPLRNYTPVVVTLWYRAPELLLGAKSYSTAIDLWSVGCIFAEFILHKPLFCGKGEIDQLNQIFKELGTPNEKIWPGFSELPIAKKVTFAKQPYNNLRKQFIDLDNSGFDLLTKLLRYDPERRVTAKEALDHPYFKEPPMPVPPSMFPTWPAKSEMKRRKSHRGKSPTPPEGGAFQLKAGDDDDPAAALAGGFRLTQAQRGQASVGAGFRLKF